MESLVGTLVALILCAAPALGQTSETPSPADSFLMAHTLLREQKISDAEALFRRILPRREAQYGDSSAEVAKVLEFLVQCLWRGGKSQAQETSQLAQRHLAICEAIYGEDHPKVATSLFSMGVIRAMGGDYTGAEPIFTRVLKIREAHLPPDHPEMVSTINALANIRYLISDFTGALPLYERSLAMAEEMAGPLYEQAVSIRGNVANVLIELGDYNRARGLLERQVALLDSADLVTEDLGYAHSLLGKISRAIEDHDEALRYRRRSLEIREAVHPAGHPRIAEALLNLGNTLRNQGEREQARTLILRARDIWEKLYGPQHPYMSNFLLALGDMAFAEGRLEEARTLDERALAIREQGIGTDTPQTAEALHQLSFISLAEERYTEAQAQLERAIQIVSSQIGPAHPLIAEYGYDLARAEYFGGLHSAAAAQAYQADLILTSHLRFTLRALPERQALRYAQQTHSPRGLLFSLLDESDDPQLIAHAWDALIRSRAMVLDEMATRTRRIALAGDSAAHHRLEVYQNTSTRLANLIVRGPGAGDPASYRRLIEDARRGMEQAERALTPEHDLPSPAAPDLGWRDVLTALPEESALVAFALYPHHSVDGALKMRYRAFIVSTSRPDPVTIDIGDAGGFDDLIANWRAQAAARPTGDARSRADHMRIYREEGELLRALLWDPVAQYLGDARCVFIVPDGQIHLLNFAALPDQEGRFLIEGPLRFHQLSAERELVPRSRALSSASRHDALLLGAPDFERAPEQSASITPRPRTGSAAHLASAPALFRGEKPNCEALHSRRFAPLPGSLREVRTVADLWRTHLSAQDASVQLLTGDQASETAFKLFAPGKRLLHIATHSYFLDPACAQENATAGASADAPSPSNPLLLSGLALAGANRRNTRGATAEDGILTAQEIASLDLSATRWAVLSACETGSGRVHGGEGVLGLRRAFRIAGARTLITSLWSVEDEATREWMVAFYKSSIAEHRGTIEAVRTASLRLLTARRERGADAHPFYWAAFIASGDWR